MPKLMNKTEIAKSKSILFVHLYRRAKQFIKFWSVVSEVVKECKSKSLSFCNASIYNDAKIFTNSKGSEEKWSSC